MNADHFNGRYARALALGALCGLRSMSGPVLASQRPLPRLGRSRLQRQLARPAVARALGTLAAAELIADKLPFVPPRIQLPSLLVRAASGAVTVLTAGAPQRSRRWIFARARGRSQLAPALAGAAAAVASAAAAYYLRRALTRRWRLPTLLGGLLEDAVLLVAAARLRS
jgi:uncharacterized membrane protein